MKTYYKIILSLTILSLMSFGFTEDSGFGLVNEYYDNVEIFNDISINRDRDDFTEHILTTNMFGAISVFSIDLDGDGDLDIIAGGLDNNSINWYENDGYGNFSEHIAYSSSVRIRYIYAIDINNDENIDILSADMNENSINWYENDGNENFTKHTISNNISNAWAVYASDINNDGNVDVLSASYGNGIYWHENDGNENFTEHFIYSISNAYSVYSSDVDSDGDIDIVSASVVNGIYWHENDGNENFTEHILSSGELAYVFVRAIDLDNDYDIDIIYASDIYTGEYPTEIGWFENDGNENFTRNTISFNTSGARCVIPKDINNDGNIDLISASRLDDKISLFENDGNENFTEQIISDVSYGAQSVFFGDFDSDGNLDIVSASHDDSKISWYENLSDNSSGCTDPSACNYDPDATEDDGSCEYEVDECDICGGDSSSCSDCAGVPNGDNELDNCDICDDNPDNDCVQDCSGEWGGDAVEDDCGVCNGDGSSCGEDDCSSGVCLSIENVDTGAGTLDIYMTNDTPIAGFQIMISGLDITNVFGGTATESGLEVSYGNDKTSKILGFSLTGETIPIGSGTLIQLSFTSFEGEICIPYQFNCQFGESEDCPEDLAGGDNINASDNNPVIADSNGNEVTSSVGDCYENDCSGIYDCAGVCEGDAVVDECGVCGGDGSSCGDSTVSLAIQNVNIVEGTLDIYMINTEEVGGFQFQLTNIEITGAYGGVAQDSGFMLITSGTDTPSGISKVLGFSLTGATIPVGEGVLTTVTFTDFNNENICFGEDTGSAGMNAIASATGGYIAADWGDCFQVDDCEYDECGVCNGDGSTCEDFGGVSLEIQNVDIDAGTLDIYMSNNAGCSYCEDSSYNNNSQDWWYTKDACEDPQWGGDTTWVSYDPITEEECSAIPSFNGNGGWWFNGEVAGFQFELSGVVILDASALDEFTISTTSDMVLGFSVTGTTIPPGNGLLTQLSFTEYEGGAICFGEDTGSAGSNVISGVTMTDWGGTAGLYVAADWGPCYCSGEYDECGVCNGLGAIYECGCEDFITGNQVKISNQWNDGYHYDVTYTLGELTNQDPQDASRLITGLKVYCLETGEIWTFDSDQLTSGNGKHDFSEVESRYENFTPSENRDLEAAYLTGYDDDATGNYHWIYSEVYATDDDGNSFYSYQELDWYPISWGYNDVSFPNLEFSGVIDFSDYVEFYSYGEYDYYSIDYNNYVIGEYFTFDGVCSDCEGTIASVGGEDVCDCDGNILDCTGECDGTAEVDNCDVCDYDSSNDCTKDCFGEWGGTAVEDECGVCEGPGAGECGCDCNNMELEGLLNFDQGLSDLTGFYQDNREFAVVGLIGQDAAVFVDITDPQNPYEVGRISGTPSGWRDLKYWNRHVYIGTEANSGVMVVSVDQPDNPTLVHTISDFGGSHNIHIDADGYLYVIGAGVYDLWIYELTDHPETPILVGTWNGEYFHDIEVYNNKLYGAAISTGEFYIIDVSDKTNPTTILNHYTGGGSSTHDCAVTYDENYLITADETRGGHIKIWDISDYENINMVSEYMTDPSHSVHNVYIRPGTDLAIISYYVDGTRILDISDPENPVEVGYYDTTEDTGLYDGNWGTYAYLPSGNIISSDRENGLFVFSTSLITDQDDGYECDSPVCISIQNVDTLAGTLDIYMENSEPVGGFQFEIFDVEMDSAFGGSAAENDFSISVNADMILGFSLTGASIPTGSGLLTSISFSNYEGGDVCFGENPINNAIADAAGYELETEWNCWGDDDPIYGCTDNSACNYDPDATDDDGSCEYGDCTPELFSYNQSNLQAFYYFYTVTIDSELVEPNDWVGAFNGDVCVGAHKWDTSLCGSGVCEVPVMGYNGNGNTEGYMNPGDFPTFKIYDASENVYFDAIPSSEIPPWENFGIDFIDNLNAHSVVNTYYLDNGNYALEFEQDSLDYFTGNGYQPEWYEDQNGNGDYDEGESFQDLNGNGIWDIALWDIYYHFENDSLFGYLNGELGLSASYYIDLNNYEFCYSHNYYYQNDNDMKIFRSIFNNNSREYCFDLFLIDQEENIISWIEEDYYEEIMVSFVPAVQGCLDTEACNFDDVANTQLYDLTLCEYDWCESPDEFTFNQSSSQAFYFVMSGTDMYTAPLESGDWIGLFNGDVCVGSREWLGEAVDIPTMGDDGFEYSEGYLQIGDIPTFKIYDASEDMIYSAIPSDNFAFADAQIFFVDEISGMLEYELSLHEGANLVSFYTLPDDNSIANVIGECSDHILGILTEGMAAACIDDQWIGTLIEIDLSDGYWILANNPDTLTGYGTNYDPGRVYDLHNGANLISYSSLVSADLSSSIPDDVEDLFLGILSQGSAAMNTEAGWVGSLTNFDAGVGYWTIVSDDLSFSYETGSMARSEIRRYIETRPSGSVFEVAQSPNQAFYFVDTITLDEGVIEDGDWLLSYNGHTLTGIRQWQGVMIDIPAMGLSESRGTEGYFKAGDMPTFKLFKQSTSEIIPLAGDIPTWTENGMYALGSLFEMQPIPDEFVLNNAYPNPFNPVTTLEFGIPVDGDVSIEVYNLQGRLIETLVSQNMKAGYHSVTWNADNHSSGMYFVKMHAGNYISTQKLMLVK